MSIKNDSNEVSIGGVVVTSQDEGGLNPFGNQRVAAPVTLFDCQFTYDKFSPFWDDITTGSGAIGYDADKRLVKLTVGSANGDRSLRRQHTWNRYQPGKAQKVVVTGVLGASEVNRLKRIGYFDDSDGEFFAQTASGLAVVLRTSTAGSGSVEERAFLQKNWNIDKLDGTGPSGCILDVTKANIYLIDFEALYVGKVRYGVDFGDGPVYCHKIVNQNKLEVPYIANANLPLSYEMVNTGNTSGSAEMYQICGTVISEGGFEDERGLTFAITTGSAGVGVTARRSVLNIRPASTFGSGSVMNRGQILPLEISALAANNPAYVEVLYGTSVSGANWQNVNANSICEYDTSGSVITGGSLVQAFYAITSGPTQARGGGQSNLLSKLFLSMNASGTVADTLSVVFTSMTGTATVSAIITEKELR